MKVIGIAALQQFSEGLEKVLRSGNGLIDHCGEPRYTATSSDDKIHLAKGEIRSFPRTCHRFEITAVTGEFWITRTNDPRDYVLKSGDTLVLEGKGMVVIEALREGRLSVRQEQADL